MKIINTLSLIEKSFLRSIPVICWYIDDQSAMLPMSKKNKKSSRKEKKRINEKDQSKKRPIWKIAAWIFAAISAVSGGVYIYDRSKSPKEKYEDEFFEQGDLKPEKLSPRESEYQAGRIFRKGQRPEYTILKTPPIFTPSNNNDSIPVIKGLLLQNKNSKIIYIMFGNSLVVLDKEYLYKGVEYKVPLLSNCQTSKISFGIKDDRVYVSVEFKDLEKEETIGIIEYNHWKLYKPNLFYWHNTDDKLEVIDKQHNIVFQIEYRLGSKNVKYQSDSQKGNFILLSGYFIDPYSVAILAYNDIPRKRVDTCISKSEVQWKEKTWKLASSIESIFPLE